MSALLKEPITINKLKLKNRLVMPPMMTASASWDGGISDEIIDYYRKRAASGDIGLIILEHSYVHPQGKAHHSQISMDEYADIDGLSRLVDAVHESGTKIFSQINHAGARANPDVTGYPNVGPSDFVIPGCTESMTLSSTEIDEIVDCFVDAALRVKEAGFDGVELHSAHCYLLDEFYSPLANHRRDEYSGLTVEGRIALQKRLVQEIRKAVGPDFPISLRLGACDYMPGGATIEDGVKAAAILEEAGLDLINVSGGINGYLRKGHEEPGWFADASSAIKKGVKIPVMVTGGVKEGKQAEQLLEEGAADLIGVGREIARDPGWPARAMKEVN